MSASRSPREPPRAPLLALRWLDDGFECRLCPARFAEREAARRHVLDAHPPRVTPPE